MASTASSSSLITSECTELWISAFLKQKYGQKSPYTKWYNSYIGVGFIDNLHCLRIITPMFTLRLQGFVFVWRSVLYLFFGKLGARLFLPMIHEVGSLFSFYSMWRDEVCHQLLVKGALLIEDVWSLHPVAYSDFISAFVAFRKRL